MSKKNGKAEKDAAPDAQQDNSKVWGAFSMVAALLAATAAKKGLNASWKMATGKEPPANSADTDVALSEALTWAAVSGTSIAVVRMLATRRAAGYYTRSVGKPPPGVNVGPAGPADNTA
jgi:hypothetical protein